ncbi:hypothetical protein [Caldisericum sp.]|uniref:hypothetical protein n=1 Tax=Caldisericum sp. TaxID=2499687 RepID=UPI003D0E7628
MEIYKEIMYEANAKNVEKIEELISEYEKIIKQLKEQKKTIVDEKARFKAKLKSIEEQIKNIIINNKILDYASEFSGLDIIIRGNQLKVKFKLTPEQKGKLKTTKQQNENDLLNNS